LQDLICVPHRHTSPWLDYKLQGGWQGGAKTMLLFPPLRQQKALLIRQLNRDALSHPYPQKAQKWMGHHALNAVTVWIL
jgi:hypothetical protein